MILYPHLHFSSLGCEIDNIASSRNVWFCFMMKYLLIIFGIEVFMVVYGEVSADYIWNRSLYGGLW